MTRNIVYTKLASVRLKPEQHRLIEQRAKRCGVRTGAWMRSILLQAAQSAAKGPSDGYLRIREPDGVAT